MSFTTFQNEKMPFQDKKKKSSKSRRIAIFLKGLIRGFSTKMTFLATFLFQVKQARKMCFAIFQNDKTPFQAIKTRSSKSQKIVIFRKGLTHGFSTKMTIFPTSFYQAKQAWKMSFTITQNQKTPFYAVKKKSSKSRKIGIFPKGLSHGFCPKMAIFPTSFCQAIQARKTSLFSIFKNKKRPSWLYKKEVQKVEKLPFFEKG